MVSQDTIKETIVSRLITASKQKIKDTAFLKEYKVGLGLEIEASLITDMDKESFINEIKNEVYKSLVKTFDQDRETLEKVFTYDILFVETE